MKGVTSVYKGRIVDKNHFCCWIYAMDGHKKLIKSWDDFESHMQTGLWFAYKKDAERQEKEFKQVPKRRVVKPKVHEEHSLVNDGLLPT